MFILNFCFYCSIFIKKISNNMIAFGEYGLGRELAEYMDINEIWTWLWFNPESYACEIIGFDTVNNKVIIYNGINFNYEVVRTLEIKDFVEEYGDTMLFCTGKL